jgi:large subunit ribosomal protein L25
MLRRVEPMRSAEKGNAEQTKQVELVAEPRSEGEIGKRRARRLRRQGYVTAVVYGRSINSIPIKIKAIDIKRAFGGLPKIGAEAILRLKTEDGEQLLKTVVKEFQVDPLSLQLLSVDFHAYES